MSTLIGFSNNSSSGDVYKNLKNGISASYERSKVISNNVSNINTKGYKRFDVVLEEKLSKGKVDMKNTDKKHINDNFNSKGYKVIRDENGAMRNDGNNVDVDIEMTNLASNSILYNALVTHINNDFSMKTNVIKGGR
ncbi:flagellar basal body rod protein FlgB [Hathewaya histolytica]|uniref:Flagellar basal body rod protein FlgB n=1 Tax=Hathewaya histolytica TaxID=1498 RepID=A0A4U9RFY9_HATHI|nr:flagellar basal body rod protein FlgB [Hathewaya histolytica]VTQ87650.1 flagellar basal body rod protein FlgB [Hathewaya histolytica]